MTFNKNSSSLLTVALPLIVLGVILAVGINLLLNPPKSEEQKALEDAALAYGELGHTESKELFNSSVDALSGETDLSDDGMKVLRGVAEGCQYSESQLGGRWVITGNVISPNADLSEAADLLSAELTGGATTITENGFLVEYSDGASVSIEELDDELYFVTTSSSCQR